MSKVRKSPQLGYPRFRRLSTGAVGPAIGIPRGHGFPVADRRLLQALIQTHRRISSPSWRLLRGSRAVLEARRHRRYYSLARGNARPAPPPVAALSEVETMFRAGFRSIRAWRRSRRRGGFPEPARVTTEGPVWTERQIAEWLGETTGLAQLDDATIAAMRDEDEQALLFDIAQMKVA